MKKEGLTMAKILISGYYGFDNAGDDSVLYGIITSLRKLDPTLELGVLSNQPEKTASTFGIKAYNRWKITEIVKRIREYDLLLMGGGSLLQDATSPRSVIYYLGIVLTAKLCNKPVVFYAQGVGPIRQTLSKRLIHFIVNKVNVITVRDYESGEDLKRFGVTKVPIIVTADPAVTIPRESIDLAWGKEIIAETGVPPGKCMAICVRSWKKEERFKQVLAEVADHYAEQGWNILFVPMQYPADITPSRDIAHLMKHKATLIDRPLNFKEIMSLLGNMDFVLGMRLHSIILAAVMNVPFVGVSYDPKIDRFIERLEMYSAGHIKEISAQNVIKYIDDTLRHKEKTRKHLARKMKEIIAQAEQSSQLTIELLNKKK